MGRMAVVVGAALAAWLLWSWLDADERVIWAALLPAVYLIGMWTLADGRP